MSLVSNKLQEQKKFKSSNHLKKAAAQIYIKNSLHSNCVINGVQ